VGGLPPTVLLPYFSGSGLGALAASWLERVLLILVLSFVYLN